MAPWLDTSLIYISGLRKTKVDVQYVNYVTSRALFFQGAVLLGIVTGLLG